MSRNRDAHLHAFAQDHPWAITPTMLSVVARILADHLAGRDADPAVIAAAVAARRDLPQPMRGDGLGVVPVYGVIAPRATMMTDASGGTSFAEIARMVQTLAREPSVKTILLDIDSPGGSAAGAAECAATLRAVRASKPIVGLANHQACSAGFWLLAQCTKVYATPSALVGSVGVYMMHDDLSEALAALGIKREYIAAGKYKTEGHEAAPLTDEARAHLQHLVSGTYDRFLADIAKGRGCTVAAVSKGYGEGRVLCAADALDAGMIDAISTFDETVARLCPTGVTASASCSQSLAATSKEPDGATGKEPGDDCLTSAREIDRALFDWALS